MISSVEKIKQVNEFIIRGAPIFLVSKCSPNPIQIKILTRTPIHSSYFLTEGVILYKYVSNNNSNNNNTLLLEQLVVSVDML